MRIRTHKCTRSAFGVAEEIAGVAVITAAIWLGAVAFTFAAAIVRESAR